MPGKYAPSAADRVAWLAKTPWDGPAAKSILTSVRPRFLMAVAIARLELSTHEHSAPSQPAFLKLSAQALKFTPPRGTTVSSHVWSPTALMELISCWPARWEDGVWDMTMLIFFAPVAFQNFPHCV